MVVLLMIMGTPMMMVMMVVMVMVAMMVEMMMVRMMMAVEAVRANRYAAGVVQIGGCD